MNKNIIISNLTKDHFRITERYGKFILGNEYETTEKGRCISIEEYLSPDECVSLAKAFAKETKTILDSFTEFVNEFFASKLEMYTKSSEVITLFGEEPERFSVSLRNYVQKNTFIISTDTFNELTKILDEIIMYMGQFNEVKHRLVKYIDILNKIAKVNNEKDDMSFSDIIKGLTVVMDHLVDVVDEYTLNTFTTKQLISLKDTCMLQIKNTQDLVDLGTLLDIYEEDEQDIHQLKASAIRLAMMVKQIDLVIG